MSAARFPLIDRLPLTTHQTTTHQTTKLRRLDLNQRPPPCRGGEHSAAPRDYRVQTGRVERPSTRVSDGRLAARLRLDCGIDLRICPRCDRTGVLSHAKRPVRGLNPSHLIDNQAATPAASQGG